jgi:hypothetical protein
VGGRVFGRCYTRPTRGDHANALGGHPSATFFTAAFGEGQSVDFCYKILGFNLGVVFNHS